MPVSELRAQIRDAEKPRGFRSALSTHRGLALIAEVKKASPSQGLIRANFDPVAIAQTYEDAGATCLSVLTDGPSFQGSLENLRACHEATRLPCLRKDFVLDDYQVLEARAWAADAILLIVAMLASEQLKHLHGCAKELGLDVLVEVHHEEEASAALELGADLIGVNNRNLHDLKTDLATTERILPLLKGKYVVAVSESAIRNHEDLLRVQAAGAKAVLIGTEFCAAPDIGVKVKEVMGW